MASVAASAPHQGYRSESGKTTFRRQDEGVVRRDCGTAGEPQWSRGNAAASMETVPFRWDESRRSSGPFANGPYALGRDPVESAY